MCSFFWKTSYFVKMLVTVQLFFEICFFAIFQPLLFCAESRPHNQGQQTNPRLGRRQREFPVDQTSVCYGISWSNTYQVWVFMRCIFIINSMGVSLPSVQTQNWRNLLWVMQQLKNRWIYLRIYPYLIIAPPLLHIISSNALPLILINSLLFRHK